MEHRNLDTIDSFFEAYGGRDLGKIRKVMSEDVTWTFRGRHPLAGVHHGLDAVLAFFDGMGVIMEKSYVNVVKLVVGVNDEYVVECQHMRTNRTDGNNIDHLMCVLWRFSGGKIVEGTHFFADPEQADRFFTGVAG